MARRQAETAALEEIQVVAGFAAIADGLDEPAPEPIEWIDGVSLALTAAGVEAEPRVQTSFELTQGGLGDREFLAQVIRAGYDELNHASWPCDGTLGDHGEVLYKDDHEGVFRLPDGTLAHVTIGYGWLRVQTAAATREQAAETIGAFSAGYPPLYRDASADGEVVPITFWTNGKFGPTSRLRMIDSATWDEIDGNYSAGVRDELGRLMDGFEPGKDGQLLLWQGSPGTGKTWALRALATEWRSWAEFNYITDPDSFFVGDPSYMINVLLSESYESLTIDGDVVTDEDPGGKWRVLILEDTGELLSANAKEAYGQGLSRLLNVVDGMVGQGLRILAIVTTNDELGDLHPAVTRPGRCASQIEFGPLTAEESEAWLAGVDHIPSEEGYTLAELFEIAGRSEQAEFAADDGMCSCGHMAASHSGADNMGACTVEDCSCASFDAAEPDSDDEPPPTTTASLYMTFTPATTANAATMVTTAATTVKLADVVINPPEEKPAPQFGGAVPWQATLAPEGQATADGRVFAPGSISWRTLPLTLMGMIETQPGHDGATVCGRIDNIWRDDSTGLIMGSGEFDTGEYGQEIARLVGDGTLRGLSVDIAVAEMEVAYRDEVLDENGTWRTDQAEEDNGEAPSLLDLLFGEDVPTVFVVKKGIIGAATVCPFPAFEEAMIEVASSLTAAAQAPNVWTATREAGWLLGQPESPQEPEEALTASLLAPEGERASEPLLSAPESVLTASAAGLAPDAPPAGWFEDPELGELTPLTVDDDGRVYGHAAAWDTCHIGIPGVCTTAPYSETHYAYFLLKEVVCDDGARVSCGTVTLDTGHAGQSLGRGDAAAHYDDTGTAVADVRVGEDEHGIWVAGALRADADAEAARKLRGSALSGDWRDVDGNLELVALLAVNVPGFPIPRTNAALVASGDSFHVQALVAAGITTQEVADKRKEQLAQTAGEFSEIAAFVEIAALADQADGPLVLRVPADKLDEIHHEEEA